MTVLLFNGCYKSAGSKEGGLDAGVVDQDTSASEDLDPGTDTDTDTDADVDTDTDTGVDTDTDTNSVPNIDTESEPSKCMNLFGRQCIATGDWCDPISGLCWVNTEDRLLEGNEEEFQGYCETLDTAGDAGVGPWEMPTIDELISLIRGCREGVATGDLSLNDCVMTPENCSEIDSCEWNTCEKCDLKKGPSSDGCYWDPGLIGECFVCSNPDCSGHVGSISWWSSTDDSSAPAQWTVDFYRGYPLSQYTQHGSWGYLRCVRRNPNEN